MEFLSELLKINSTNSVLNLLEGINTLKEIDLDLLSSMKSVYKKWIKMNDKDDANHEITMLNRTLRTSSPLRVLDSKNVKAAFIKFKDPANKVIGLVFKVDNDQIFAISNIPSILGLHSGYIENFTVSFKAAKFEKMFDEDEYKHLISKISYGSALPSRMEIDDKKALIIINAFLRISKKLDKQSSVLMILADSSRTETINQ